MTPLTVARFLIGDREAILRLAATRWSLLIGAVLVFSASLARNYDGKALPHEGEALLHGITVSFGNALILFTIFYLIALAKKGPRPRPPYIRGFLAFLGLFWLTSPMAWLYGIPYERFLSPVEAIDANMFTLALVSVWRVALMVRVLSVLFEARPLPTFCIVAFYGDALIFAAAVMMKVPVLDFMGGLQHSPEDERLAGLQFSTVVWSVLAAPVLFIAAIVGLKKIQPVWSLFIPRADARPSWGLIALSIVAITAWIPALMVTQPEQHNRLKAEQLLLSERVGEAIAFMAATGRQNFPPVWDPPPRVGYFDRVPDARDIRSALIHYNARDWASDLFFEKHWRITMRESFWGRSPTSAQLLERFGSIRELDDDERASFAFHARHDHSLPPDMRSALQNIVNTHKAKDESSFFEDPPKR